MDLNIVKTRLGNEWKKMNEHQGMGSLEMFKLVYGYGYDTNRHRQLLNPISGFMSRMIKEGRGYKDYRYGGRNVLYVKQTAAGGTNLIDKFIHVCDCNLDSVFDVKTFQKTARLIWELKEEAVVAKDFISAALNAGLMVQTANPLKFHIIKKSTTDTSELIKKVMADNQYLKKAEKGMKVEIINPANADEPLVSIKKSAYNDMVVTLAKQAETIKALKTLKCELIDQVTSLTTALKTNNEISVVDPTELLEKAKEDL